MTAPRTSAAAQLRRRQVYGILLLAVLILAFTLFRADWHALFPTGWWRW
jgi:hypothetical protein